MSMWEVLFEALFLASGLGAVYFWPLSRRQDEMTRLNRVIRDQQSQIAILTDELADWRVRFDIAVNDKYEAWETIDEIMDILEPDAREGR